MNSEMSRSGLVIRTVRQSIALLCAMLLIPGDSPARAQQPDQSSTPAAANTATVAPEELDSLVAPIALYPDPLIAQTLAASTYPLEIIQLWQWLGKHKDLKDKALAEAVQKESWDASVQAMAAFPDVVKLLSENIKWTTELGNAFLAQQSDVMDAVQRMRARAKETGNLKSSEQQKVETKVIENKNVIVIEPSKPDVVYVPSYNPTVVYGAPPPYYPYPPVAYPPPGYYAAGMAISFGVGMMVGAAVGGGWGWGCGWGGNNNITVNRNNTFVNNSVRGGNNIRGGTNIRGGNSWQHNPQHRGGAPYGDRNTANRFGGTARGDSLGNRQNAARRNQGQLGDRQQPGQLGSRQQGGRQQPGQVGGARTGTSDRAAGGGRNLGGGGGDRVGNRQLSNSSGGKSGAFGGSGGFNGGAARSSSSRGSRSFGGGGGRGGGSRGGGRRR